jgi:hypothetical protein
MSEQFNPLEKRMETMMTVIDTAILSTDNRNDQLMLACAMLQRTREIFDMTLGVEGRKEMFRGLTNDEAS